ncbi:MAG: phospho-N-acetylmuramoyl-pentapeptide-transferase [Candidatus Staskawiczbacteria bacterium]|nr:phospho-N-acetylmuramoyl-pentapeptide-transferase [Candidatus Staskawiczbacteria bacterium]
MTLFTFNVIKVLGFAAVASVISAVWCPFLINFLYKHKLWKKEARIKAISGEDAVIFHNLHKEREITVPRFGGLLILITVVLIVLLFYWFPNLNFLSRSQTWLPLFTLISASLLGFLDDFLQIFGKGKYIGGGLSFKKRLLIVILIAIIGGVWFYSKLGWDVITIPLLGQFSIGIFYIPLFVLVMVATWSGGIIDGLDGLAGGTFASIFGAFTIIAFSQGKVDLAIFCAIITGTLFTFLWFNIPPARFYMGETGTLGLTTVLSVVAFLTDSVFVLPIIAGLLVLETGSVIIQLLSKKFRKKKIFLSAPIHHHFEAIGWPQYKITMRAWILGIVFAIVGVAVRLLG